MPAWRWTGKDALPPLKQRAMRWPNPGTPRLQPRICPPFLNRRIPSCCMKPPRARPPPPPRFLRSPRSRRPRLDPMPPAHPRRRPTRNRSAPASSQIACMAFAKCSALSGAASASLWSPNITFPATRVRLPGCPPGVRNSNFAPALHPRPLAGRRVEARPARARPGSRAACAARSGWRR